MTGGRAETRCLVSGVAGTGGRRARCSSLVNTGPELALTSKRPLGLKTPDKENHDMPEKPKAPLSPEEEKTRKAALKQLWDSIPKAKKDTAALQAEGEALAKAMESTPDE